MATTEELREDLARVLDRAERWLTGLKDAQDLPGDLSDLDVDVRTVYGSRTRALSALLNVGLLGRFSSGKSFLISGLQGGLEFLRVPDGQGDLADKYVGILPSEPTTTTACPSTVVPVSDGSSIEASGRGLLRVQFVDSPDWVDIGVDLPPAVVAAYGAADGDVGNRVLEHVNREVAEIELWISKAALPAKLYDLPGSESPNATHEAIMKRAWAEADCFIYVSQATAVLAESDLELIGELYKHHLQSGKRVIWVLTGIDRASQLGNDNRRAWMTTRDQNNVYLRQHYGSTQGHPDAFIGEGFIPVSPALEAQAAFEEAEGNAGSRRLRDAGRMDGLRDRLTAMIEEGAGQWHLAQIADETRRIVRKRRRPITDMLQTHQVPVSELEEQRADVRRRLDRTEESATRARTRLGNNLDRRTRVAQDPFRELARVLHQGLDELIGSGSLNAEHANEINVHQSRVFTEWMNSENGPATLWQRQLEKFETDCRSLVRLELNEDGSALRLVPVEPLDIDQFLKPADSRQAIDVYRLVQAAAAAVAVAGGLAGGAAWLMTTLSILTIVPPVTAAVATAATALFAAKMLSERQSIIDRARRERIAMLDQQAQNARDAFNEIVRDRGLMLIDAVESNISEHHTRLEAALAQINDRINDPNTVRSRDLVTYLTPFDQEAEQIITELLRFSHAHRD